MCENDQNQTGNNDTWHQHYVHRTSCLVCVNTGLKSSFNLCCFCEITENMIKIQIFAAAV